MPVQTKPSLTGAAIAGSIVFGVLFLFLLAALFHYSSRSRFRSSAPISRPERARTDDWANHICELLRLPRALFTERLHDYYAQRAPFRPRTDWHGPTAGSRYMPTPSYLSVGSEWLPPPPPYDPSYVLPVYSSDRSMHAVPESPSSLGPDVERASYPDA
ncbi:hypothetical protein C8Q70DRAFT_1057534 [Cubamyces menziesii]|nr:hypothetical protein C8Q70DRAFT_1057534 [Cubamyces menziesii]